MASRFGISEKDVEKLRSVFGRYAEVGRVVIYGSRSKGNYRPGSDIDLTIMGPLDWQTFNQLEVELDDLLLPYQIDLSVYEHIDNAELKAHIQRIGQDFFVREAREADQSIRPETQG